MIDLLGSFKIIFGLLYVVFLPGLAWSFVLFTKKEIDWIERIVLSFGLSIVIVPITIYWLNLFPGIRITLVNVSIIILAIIGLAAWTYRLKDKYTIRDLFIMLKGRLKNE